MKILSIDMSVIFVASCILSFGAVGAILKLSRQNGWFDHVNERKVHRGDIPRLGGLGFSVVFLLIATVIAFITKNSVSVIHYLPCLGALLLILVFGVYDDFRPLPSRYKLLIQIIAALIVIAFGFNFKQMFYFHTGILSGIWGYPITLLWIVGLTNAVNLIDGVDGLAGGVSVIIALFFGLIFFFHGINLQELLFCIALVGVLAGFLVYNAPIPKAKIFMGDGGSQFLGFLLALLPLLAPQNTPAALPVPYAAALLMIPIFDTISAVLRRLRDGQSIASPDKAHIHHKLMNLGLNAQGVTMVLCSLQITLGVLVFISISLGGMASLYVLGAAYMTGTAFFVTIHFAYRAAMKKLQYHQTRLIIKSI